MLHLKVRKINGEQVRKRVLEKKILDERYRILKDRDFLYFPIQKNVKIPHTEIVEKVGEEKIKTKERGKSLKELLKGKLTKEELNLLPRSFDIIGDILILELDEKLEKKKKKIGEAFLKLHKSVKVILRKKSERKGEFRTRAFEILAGERRTETLHKEYGCLFKLDVAKVYFSPREANERQMVAKQVKRGEEVLVMFSGVSPFAIQIAKKQKKCKITCVEKNPLAFKYAEENIRINKVGDKVKNICGDIREVSKKFLSKGKKFSRIIMPLPKGAYNFLPLALPLLKEEKRGILHFYHWAKEDDLFSGAEKLVKEATKKFGKKKVKILEKRKVLPYSPRTWKVVLDVEIK
jgi:tRNA (guanine37-N1)-methyltransferase